MSKSLLQTQEWADLKISQGWKAQNIDNIFVLEKSLPFGKSFLYAPEVTLNSIQGHPGPDNSTGPGIQGLDSGSTAGMTNFVTNIRKNIENSHAIFFRLEILDEFDEKIIEILKKNNFIKAFEELQPEWRQIIDISKSEAEILAGMKPKGRYNIKIAEKNQVKVEKVAPENLLEGIDIFYELFRKTAKNQGFSIRPKKYFQDLMLKLLPKGEADLLIAKLTDIPVAALIVTYYDGVASYLYGASSNEYRNVMAPYLAHWQAIRLAKEKSCQTYDLLAVAPEGVENHKYAGITRFKEQFGGRKVHLVGSYDMIYKPSWYKMFRIAEKYRRN